MTTAKIPGLADKFRRGAYSAKGKASSTGRSFKTKSGNFTSTGAKRQGEGYAGTYGGLGRSEREDLKFQRLNSATVGAGAGSIVAGGASAPSGKKRARKYEKEYSQNAKTLKDQRKQLKKRAPRYLITDVGTSAGKFRDKKGLPGGGFRPVAFGAGVGAGAGGVAGTQVAEKKIQQKSLANQRKKIQQNQKKLSKSMEAGMSTSAFGIDHGDEVNKKWNKDQKQTAGFTAGGAALGGLAGRKLTAGSKAGTLAAAGLGAGAGAAASPAGRKNSKDFKRQYKRKGAFGWEEKK